VTTSTMASGWCSPLSTVKTIRAVDVSKTKHW
jgi:hypothetical protein